MKQFLLPADYDGSPEWTLTGEAYHYLITVRRMRAGDRLRGRDRAGRPYRIDIKSISGNSCRLQILPDAGTGAAPGAGETELILQQCLPKGKKADTVLRQAAETGISEVQLIESRNSVARLPEGDDAAKRRRWEKILQEALQQSGQTRLTVLGSFYKLPELPELKKGELGLLFYEKPLATPSLHEYCSWQYDRIAILIGSEGGFTEEEVRLLQDKGYKPVFLGPGVLRTETAALYACAAVQTILREKKRWQLRE